MSSVGDEGPRRGLRHRDRLTVVWAGVAMALAGWAFIGGHWLAGAYLAALPVVMAALLVTTRPRRRRLDHVDGPSGRSR